MLNKYIRTYIFGHYNLSGRIIDLVSHTTYICVLILCMSGGVFRFKPTAYNRFLKSFSWQILFTLILVTNMLRGGHLKNTLSFSWRCLTCDMSNKPTHYLLDYGNFNALKFTPKYWRNLFREPVCEWLFEWNTDFWILVVFDQYTYIHTYIIGHYNPFSQDYWAGFSHHLCCVC